MKTFATSFLLFAVALAIASAVPVEVDSPAAAVEENPGVVATKQNPFTEAIENINQFIQNIPNNLPALQNVFANPSTEAGAAAPAKNPLQQALDAVGQYVQERVTQLQNVLVPTTTQATKTETSSPAPVPVATETD